MNKTSVHYRIGLLGIIGVVFCMSSALAQMPPDKTCNFKWANVCYANQVNAEDAMRATSPTHELLEIKEADDDTIAYHIPPVPPLPLSWHGEHITSGLFPVFGPTFASYGEALAWTIAEAAQTSEEFPTKIVSNDLVRRGETNVGGLIHRYFSHNYQAVNLSSIDFAGPSLGFCGFWTDLTAEARISFTEFHWGISPVESAPFTAEPNIVSYVFNSCIQSNGIFWQIWGLPVIEISQVQGISCNPPYTFDGVECSNDLMTQILKGPFMVLGTPPQQCAISDRTDPCDAANGNKSEVETDYSTTAEGGLSFARYYNSQGPYKSAQGLATGWRHSYSRTIDEQPDKNRLPKFVAPANQSESYATREDACVFGWDGIKGSVWGGDLAAATASFAGGNVCEISLGGSTAAYFPVRDAKTWSGFTPAPGIRTITRPNGSNHQFQQSGTDWVNVLNPALKLEQSGANWIFTDSNDTKETYDSGGKLLSISRRNGQIETLEYNVTAARGGDDNSATLDRVTGAFGHALTFAYDVNGRLVSVTTPDGTVQYGYDGNDNLTSVTYPDLSTRQYVFEDTVLPNHMTGLIDENGDRFATWDYDDAGRAILSELAGGKERVQLAYNVDKTTTLTMADGSIRNYAFSTQQGQRRVSAVSGDTCASCAGGNVRDRTYDANGFVASRVDWNNNVTNMVRDGRGLITTLVEAAGSAVERNTLTEWHADYRLPTKITAPQNITDLSYDTSGNLLTQIITGGIGTRTWTFTYNSSGQPLTIDGPRTDVADLATLAYYECATGTRCGQLQSVTNALGHVMSYDSYDTSGRLLAMTDPNGLQSAFSYDPRGRLLTVTQTPTSGTPRVTAMIYDTAGQVETMSMPDGLLLTYTYDAAHYLSSVSDNFGNRIDYDYDSMGNQTVEDSFDPGNVLKRALAYSYDLNYRLDAVTSGGFVTDLTFDALGNLTAETDPKLANTQHGYDALNRLDDTIDALTGTIDYVYDDHDNLTSISTANSAVTTYEYDDLDNLIKEIGPDRGQLIYSYDNAGNRVTELDARGKLTTYAYDALNRLTLVTFDGGQTIAYQYDAGANAIGRLNRITDSSGQTDWTYDNFGAVTQKQQTIGSVVLTTGYSYDSNGRLSTMTLPSGKVVTYGYKLYLQNSVSVDGQIILSGATYDPFGPLTGWTWGNGTPHSRGFDQRGLLSSQSMVTDTRTLAYDAAGQVTSILDSRHDLTFDYDLLGRLSEFASSGNGSGPPSPMFSATPAVLADIQSTANETASPPTGNPTPWLTTAVRNVSATGAEMALERAEVESGSVTVPETIGFVAIAAVSSGNFLANGGTIVYEAQTTSKTIKGWDNGCYSTSFLNSYATAPLVVATINTHDGKKGGWIRRCSLGTVSVGFTVDNDTYRNSNRPNKKEAAGLVAFSAAFDARFTDAVSTWGMEAASVVLADTSVDPTFKQVTFRQAYATVPIVVVLATEQDSAPAAIRIRNVTPTGFEAVQVEPANNDGEHGAMTMRYLAIESGVHELPDGTRIEAGFVVTDKQQHGKKVSGAEGWETLTFSNWPGSAGGAPLPASQVFSYDANGNRETITEEGIPYTYTNLIRSNRLLSTTGPAAKTYSYDAAGNVVNDGIHSYNYDDRGRLTSVDSGLATYQHNGQGQRVTKDDGSRILFAYDEAGMLIGEYDSLGTAIQETVYFNGAPVSILQGANEYFVHTDQLGTPRIVTDGNTVIWRWESDPFGTTAAQEDPDGDLTPLTNNLRFPGHYYDQETGNHYNYFRTFDPSTGRYLESDPIGLAAGPNTYGYVGGNPLAFADPLGLERIRECFHFFIRPYKSITKDRRITPLYSFNWPGGETTAGPDIDFGKGRNRIPRPGLGIAPTTLWVDQYDVFRVDLFEIMTTAEIWEARCQTIVTNDCTGAIEEVYEGTAEYRLNEEVTEILIDSFKDYTRTSIWEAP